MDGARYLDDGKLTIFRRNGTYYARLRTTASDKYIVRSLKTTNEQNAIQAGRRLLFQIEQRADQGLPPKSTIPACFSRCQSCYRATCKIETNAPSSVTWS